MTTVGEQLQALIDDYYPLLKSLPEDDFLFKPFVDKWSKKEIIGHLIDSAQNNIRRFIVTQYEVQPTVVYDQDKWVGINSYQHGKTHELVDLWFLLNKQASNILLNTPQHTAQQCSYGNELLTIEWLAQDYIKHLRHHLHQVLNLEPVAYP